MSTHLDPGELAYWKRYLRTLPEELRPGEPRVTAGPAGTLEITDHLVAL